MKKLILIALIPFILGNNCCQPEGNYEECLEKGGALCIDAYPKCPEEKEEL